MFKQKGGGNLEIKNKQRGSTPKGRFYSMDGDDAYWRLSFGDEKIQGRRSTGGINPLWYDNDYDHEFEVPVSDFKSFGLSEIDVSRNRNFSEMVSDIKRMREKRGKQRTLTENGTFRGENVHEKAGFSTRGRKDVKSERGIDDGGKKISNSGERYIFPIEPENMVQLEDDHWKSGSRKQLKSPNVDWFKERSAGTSVRESVSDWQKLEERKLKEIKVKTESKKISRESQSRKTKAYSPRTECKIRALEEMKKSRMKMKKQEREKVLEGNTIFDSFAVVKNSFDPQKDFRESMVEMIRERRIGHPEDLEDLLASYLTLNCDEYHDLIIKVFRQVWFELKGVYINQAIENDPYFGYYRID